MGTAVIVKLKMLCLRLALCIGEFGWWSNAKIKILTLWSSPLSLLCTKANAAPLYGYLNIVTAKYIKTHQYCEQCRPPLYPCPQTLAWEAIAIPNVAIPNCTIPNIVNVAFSGGPNPDMLLHLGVLWKYLICSEDMYNFWKNNRGEPSNFGVI